MVYYYDKLEIGLTSVLAVNTRLTNVRGRESRLYASGISSMLVACRQSNIMLVLLSKGASIYFVTSRSKVQSI